MKIALVCGAGGGSGVLLGLPFLCRIIGVALVPAGWLILYYWRRPRRWVILGAAVAMVPWILWMLPGLGAWHHDPVTGYYTDYLGWWGSTGPALLGKVAAGNLVFIIWSIAKLSLEGLNQWLTHVALWPIVATFLGLISLIGVLGRLGRGQVLPFYLLFFLMVVLLWPWSPFRLLVPILPFVIAYLLAGMLTLFGNLPEKLWFRSLAAGLVSVLVLANLTLLYQDRVLSRRTGFPYPGIPSHFASWTPASWTQYQDLFHWLEANTRPGDVLAAWEDPMLYLYTGRISIRTFEATPAPPTLYGEAAPSLGTVADLRRTLRTYQVRYVVKMPGEEKEVNRLVDGLQQQYPDWVKTMWVGQDRRFAVLALGQEK